MRLLEVTLSVYPVKSSAYDSTGKADYAFSPTTRRASHSRYAAVASFWVARLAASASVVAGALAGCQRPSTLKVVQPTTGGGRDDLSDSVIGKDKIRIGMEAAYAPYNWQVSEASEYTIPIDNVQGAYADGYDVQIAKIVCKALGGEPVAVKQSFSGLIDSLNNGQIDLIIAGMSATPEREESVGFSDPYFIGYFGLFVKEGSPYQNATKLSDFSGATVLGQKDTMLDTVIDEIPGVVHKNPVDSVPTVFSNLLQGTCDAVTYNTENEKGYMAQNPGYRPHPILPRARALSRRSRQTSAAARARTSCLSSSTRHSRALAKRSATKCGTRASTVSRHREAA